MPGYPLSLHSKDTIDTRYLCALCGNILRDPVQTDCGHVYCSSCVQELKREDGSFTCLVDEKPFDKVFLDNFVKREVLSLIVACSNSKDGCLWKGEVRHSEKHLLSCPEEKQRCSNHNCPESIKRSELQRHVEEECSYRLQLCSLCGQSMTAAVLKVGVWERCVTATPLCTIEHPVPEWFNLPLWEMKNYVVKRAFFPLEIYAYGKCPNV